MRLLIDTSGIQFRVSGTAKGGRTSRTRTGRPPRGMGEPIWTVRLDAIDTERETKETIWVEVAGEQPELTFDGYALVHGLVFAPWVGRDGKIRRSFRAEAVEPVRSVSPSRLPSRARPSGTIPLPRDQDEENPDDQHPHL